MSKTTKCIFLIGIVLLGYGYLCRELGIYFFWDSKSFGGIFLFIGVICYLFNVYKTRKMKGKRTVWVRIGIAFFLLGFLIFPCVVYLLKTSDAYQTATEYLRTNSEIKGEVGSVKGFGLIPTGEIETSTINDVESGYAIFYLIVRGDRKYKDVTIKLRRVAQVDWTVISVK